MNTARDGSSRALSRKGPAPGLATSPGTLVGQGQAAVAAALVLALVACDDPLPSGFHLESHARSSASHAGDPTHGRALFDDPKGVGCARCHRVKGQGGDLGPDLTDVGAKLDREHLVEAVLYPSRQFVEGYRTTVVALHDGRVFSGLVRSESTDELVLVDSEGKPRPIRTSEVEDRRLGDESIMPDGLTANLTPDQFADLIAYLQSLRSAEQPSPGSGVTGPVHLPPGFVIRKVADGITGATALAVAPDGRVFVAEQTGALKVVERDRMREHPVVTLDVDSTWERGLLGMALDPEFQVNGWIYVLYVSPRPFPHHRVSRILAGGEETILFEGDDQRRLGGAVPNGHQGGGLAFDRDGKLYVSIGDQTANTQAQDMSSLQGKLLRLNRDGSIPPDNPFFARASGKYRATWALGLRNPFKIAVQAETGRIYLNDVGGNAEEINEASPGANFGWPVVEHGPTTDRRFRGPVYSYPTASITGGAFCPRQGVSQFPEEYRDRYFFMDFVKGWIKTLDPDRPSKVADFASGLARPVDLAFAPDGSLYVLVRDAWVRDSAFKFETGSLHRIDYIAAGRKE